MKTSLRKRGQKFVKRFSRASLKASEESKEHIKENVLERVSHIANVKLLVLEWGLMVMALIMLAVTQAFWFNASYAEETFVAGGTYTEATVGRVNSLNPLFATTNSEKVLSRLMFAPLVATDYSGNVGYGLANALSANEDGKIWKVKLREGLKWSDGVPLTNEDVLFTVALIQNPVVNSIYEPNLENVKVSENESGEIVFELASSYADFASALEIPIVPKHELDDATLKTLVEDSFSVEPVTSGAFSYNAVQATATTGEEIYYLSANSNYYKGVPMLGSFAVRTYLDKDSIVAGVNGKQVTATAELSGLEADKVVAGGYEMKKTAINSGAFAFFNTNSANMRNKDLRRAIRSGLNMETLRGAVSDPEPLDYPLISSQIQLEAYPEITRYNLETAREQVAAVLAGTRPEISVATVNSGYLPLVSNALVEQLQALGLEAKLNVYEENQEFVANVIAKRNYDILVYEVELGADPDPLPYYHSSQASGSGLNLSNYRNTLVDDLLVGARETLDTTLRAKKYESFLEYWVDDVPAIGLYRGSMTYIYNSNTRNYNDRMHLVTPFGRFIDVEQWGVARGSKNLTP